LRTVADSAMKIKTTPTIIAQRVKVTARLLLISQICNMKLL
jgi:hypothetical protein